MLTRPQLDTAVKWTVIWSLVILLVIVAPVYAIQKWASGRCRDMYGLARTRSDTLDVAVRAGCRVPKDAR
jgi:hypothetical protein